MRANLFLAIFSVIVGLSASAPRAAENLVAQLEKCIAPQGFEGSLYSRTPGDRGIGYHLRLRVQGGNGYYTRDNYYNSDAKTYFWHPWKQVPRIAATSDNRLRIEIVQPVMLITFDVSIDVKMM